MLPIMAPLAQFLATEGIEGIRLQTYDDKTGDRLDEGETPVGKASIAVGLIKYSDGTPVKPGDELTLQEAWDETYHYLNKVLAPALSRLITVNLPDHKLMAFASWLYNFGETKARKYSLPKLINSGSDDRVIIEKWMEYINAGGRPQLGLYRRRMAEVLMWLDLDWRPALNASFDDSVFELIETLGGDVPPPLVDDILFDEDEVTADLNRAQLEGLKTGKSPVIMPVGKKPLSINSKPPEDVPYGIDPKAPLQPKEDAERYRRAVKKEKGVEMKKLGEALTIAGTTVASANVASDEVRTFFGGLGQIGYTLIGVAICVGALYWIIGKIRERHNERKEVEAEINAVQGMY
ncbi:MAG: hypothetical protein HRT82_17490 [Henriciella sp.]|nr:hypothetical protein [Henriciella sp.]